MKDRGLWTRDYEALYAQYHTRGIEEILGLLGDSVRGGDFLDLCAGDGRLSRRLTEAGARSVTLVDSAPHIIPQEFWSDEEHYRVFVERVRTVLLQRAFDQPLFDGVVCQQAINYWFEDRSAYLVARVLKPGGLFVFNTFNERPDSKPRVSQYELHEHSFVEVSWLIGDMVHHLQVRDGLSHHHTRFRWISPEGFQERLDPYFVIEEFHEGRTSRYRCRRREKVKRVHP